MDLKDKNKFGFIRLLRSFVYAWTGMKYVLKHEQNMRIHLFISVLVIALAIFLQIPTVHFLILLIVIGIVLSLEVMNTAIERTIDFVTDEYHPLAKIAKDVAAAAVFVFSLLAIVIGILIFLPPIIHLFFN